MFLVILGVIASMASAPSDEKVRSAAQELLSDSDIQKKLPKADKDNKETADLKSEEKRRGQRGTRRARRKRGPRGGGTISTAILYTGMAVAVGLLLFWFTRDLFGYQQDGPIGDGDEAISSLDRAVVERPLEDAEALAKRGAYADAVHTLLLRTVMELSQRRGQPLPSSFTSREILERVGLPNVAREALAEIVNVVELSHFGDIPIGADEWRRCLESYGRFSSAYLSEAAA